MRLWLLTRLLAPASVAASLASPAATAPAPGEDRLEAALLSADPGTLAELGARASTAGLEPHLHGARRARIAACRAAPAAEDAWALLAPLARTAGDRDRGVAREAALAAEQIAARLDRDEVLLHDIPADRLTTALERWRALGADSAADPAVRVRALAIGRRLHDALGPDAAGDGAFDVAARLADPDPELRRAALELVPIGSAPPALLRPSLSDPEPPVAGAAAQALCAPLGFGAPAEPILAALGADGLATLRELTRRTDLEWAALVDVARCLEADGASDSAAAVRDLRARAPRALRDSIGSRR